MSKEPAHDPKTSELARPAPEPKPAPAATVPRAPTVPEIGGRKGLDPTRYGDWEKDGRCVDF
ncbi:MAG TPA: DUF1674 domain-containing protein [Alphaproteobacteria bacterium]|jgi:hypothetical protein